MKILNVEDEPELAAQISAALQHAKHEVVSARTGPTGLKLALTKPFDIIVLDVNLPGMDGFEVLRQIRTAKVPSRVLVLTARAEVADRVAGLKEGADDYLTKPFAMEEFLARVEALGRRSEVHAPQMALRCADLQLDVVQRKLTRGGEVVSLSPREFEVLHIFMGEPGRVFSRDEICERIWQREHEYDTRTVEIFIMRLRKKIDEGREKPLIETVRGVGYRFGHQ